MMEGIPESRLPNTHKGYSLSTVIPSNMAKRDWREASDMLRDAVRMASWPVGVKMLPDAKSVHEFPSVKLLQKTALCQMAARAKYYREEGVVAASSRGMKCVWGAACVGLIDTPERLKDGLLYLPYTDTMEAAQELHRSIGMLGDQGKRYGSILMAPLDLMPVDPDVIVMYANPSQALRLIVAYLYETGKAIEQRITGQVSLCTSIAKVLGGNEFCVDIPCIGDRAYGVLQEQELLLAVHPKALERLKIGLLGTEMLGSYPFKPFLNWPVVLRPDMETMEFDY